MNETGYTAPDLTLVGAEHVRRYLETGGEVGHEWNGVPALVLTTSKYHGDVNRSYLEGANTFFSKPSDYPSLVAMIGIICDYWFNTALHPAPDPDRPPRA